MYKLSRNRNEGSKLVKNNGNSLPTLKKVIASFRKESVDGYNIHLMQVIIWMQIYGFDVMIFNKRILAFQP